MEAEESMGSTIESLPSIMEEDEDRLDEGVDVCHFKPVTVTLQLFSLLFTSRSYFTYFHFL